jgi:hypothetical protein
MAQVTRIELVDDIDGSEAHETVEFSLDGKNYVIDLSDKHAAALRENLADFIPNARKLGGGPARRRSSGGSAARSQDTAAMREWGRANGFSVSDRGRVSQQVRKAYLEAHGQA